MIIRLKKTTQTNSSERHEKAIYASIAIVNALESQKIISTSTAQQLLSYLDMAKISWEVCLTEALQENDNKIEFEVGRGKGKVKVFASVPSDTIKIPNT